MGKPLGIAGFFCRKRFDHAGSTDTGQLAGELVGGLAGNRHAACSDVVSCVKGKLDFHRANTRVLVAFQDGALDGSGAAPTRQKRRMHVVGAQARNIEHRLRQEHAVGGHDYSIRLEGGKLLHSCVVFEGCRGKHRDSKL